MQLAFGIVHFQSGEQKLHLNLKLYPKTAVYFTPDNNATFANMSTAYKQIVNSMNSFAKEATQTSNGSYNINPGLKSYLNSSLF